MLGQSASRVIGMMIAFTSIDKAFPAMGLSSGKHGCQCIMVLPRMGCYGRCWMRRRKLNAICLNGSRDHEVVVARLLIVGARVIIAQTTGQVRAEGVPTAIVVVDCEGVNLSLLSVWGYPLAHDIMGKGHRGGGIEANNERATAATLSKAGARTGFRTDEVASWWSDKANGDSHERL